MKRVYHPTSSAWHDVPDGQVEDWTKLGWKTSKPSGFSSEDEALTPVGESYTPVDVPAEPDVAAETAPPSGNASADEWRGYALSQGASEEDLEGLSRRELRETYGNKQ